MRLAEFEAERREEVEAGVHAVTIGELATGRGGQHVRRLWQGNAVSRSHVHPDVRSAANGFKTAVLFGVLSALLVGLGGYFFGTSGLLIGLGIAVAINAFAYFNSDKIALRSMRARPVSEAEQPAMYRIVRELATTARQPMPRLYVSPTEAPNAFATGR